MQSFFLYLMSFLYALAGLNHFINPKFYLKIIPSWIPLHNAVNYGSGSAEIILSVLLIPLATRITAAWLIIVLLILIFPANIKMCMDFYSRGHAYFWVTFLRLPLQLVLIWWAWVYTR